MKIAPDDVKTEAKGTTSLGMRKKVLLLPIDVDLLYMIQETRELEKLNHNHQYEIQNERH